MPMRKNPRHTTRLPDVWTFTPVPQFTQAGKSNNDAPATHTGIRGVDCVGGRKRVAAMPLWRRTKAKPRPHSNSVGHQSTATKPRVQSRGHSTFTAFAAAVETGPW